MGSARKAALTVLERCRRGGAWSDALLGSVMDAEGLRGPDRGLASALCYGVLQNRMLLDYVVELSSTIQIQRIEPKVLDILRLSAYQILMMDKIPASAAVNEGVKLCRGLGYARAAGFVNAVLRRICEQPPKLPEGKNAQSLSLRYSHPLWLVELLTERLGPGEAEMLLRCHNDPVPVTLQVNTLRTSAASLMSALSAQGLPAEIHSYLPDCLLLHGGNVSILPQFQNGDFYVQDAGAKLAVLAAAPQPGQEILDVCAAPGGKSFAAAMIAPGAKITACDLHENKLRRIRDGSARLGIGNITAHTADARSFRAEWEGRFPLVIADVPCSGLGVIRKKPDIRYKDPAEFAGLSTVQADILRNVSRYVAPGGTLLYSTCTIRQEENEDIVRDFLAANDAFSAVDFALPGDLHSEDGMLQLWPQKNGTDGFFIAKMRRRT